MARGYFAKLIGHLEAQDFLYKREWPNNYLENLYLKELI